MGESEKTCGACKHFRQHYIKAGYRYDPIHYGHCVYPRLKKRETAHKACEHFKERKIPSKTTLSY